MPNGETVKRDWILYSRILDAVHCFCCRIFAPSSSVFSSINGFKDWTHLTRNIKIHEVSTIHIENYVKWKKLSKTFANEKCVDNQICLQIHAEKERLKLVFKRIISLILYFARQNIAFTGSSSNLHDISGKNGNFQQLVHTVASFDDVLKEHMEKCRTVHYLSPKIQNELISIIGKRVRNEILQNIKESKYFSSILDSTPDVKHLEQMTLVLRYVFLDVESQAYEIRESFIEFLNIHIKTGLGISDVFITELKSLGLDLNNLRGQSYDNGSNMRGKNIGVQKQILLQNPRAAFVACCDHSLNLLLNDAAAASGSTVRFFSLVNHIFVFLSGSTNRWDVLSCHIAGTSSLAPKAICSTRWSSRIEAIKPLKRNLDKIIEALHEIRDSEKFDVLSRHEAGCIADKIDFTFICSVCVWHDVLYQVNIVSKKLQSIQSNVQSAVTCLKNIMKFLVAYESSFENVLSEAKQMAEGLEIDPKFSESEKRPSIARFLSTKEDFRSNFFDLIIEIAKNALEERFESLQAFNETFSFLYDFQNYEENRSNGELMKSCKHLESVLTHNGEKDIDGIDLFHEFPIIATIVENHNVSNVLDILNAIKKDEMENLLPNAVIAYRIFLTVPVSVASGERSFSKLKLIKNYLRNSMGQERLNSLAIISIENEIAKSIQYDEIIDDFANAKARKMNFE